MFHWSHSLQGFLTVPLVNWYCASLHVVLHMNAFTVVLKWKIYYDCGVCSSNLQIYFSSLRIKHYYIKWETLTWLLLGKKQSNISVLLSLNFVPSLTCPDGFTQFSHFQCQLQQHCACTTLVWTLPVSQGASCLKYLGYHHIHSFSAQGSQNGEFGSLVWPSTLLLIEKGSVNLNILSYAHG